MLEIIKDPTFAERNIPLGILEVTYPDRSAWDITKFYDLVHAELDADAAFVDAVRIALNRV